MAIHLLLLKSLPIRMLKCVGKHKLVNEELVVSDDKGIANVVLFVRSKGVTVHPDLEDGSKSTPLVS